MDNFEWHRGYEERFGLIWVNFTDPKRTIMWKDSAKYYKGVVEKGFVQASQTSSFPIISVSFALLVIALFL